jgi:beta-glucosidase
MSFVISALTPSGEWNVANRQSGARADEDYLRYSESVQLTEEFGFGAARMSIAWPRVMTYSINKQTGKLEWVRNEKGLAHYRSVLKAYAAAGISVALTMFHWDLPLVIEEYAASNSCGSAWLCPTWMAGIFKEYADLLLTEFKDMVAWWITINEPLTIVKNGYSGKGKHAPGRCSDRKACWVGDSRTEPYTVAKGLILAHARAFRAWEAFGKPGMGCGMTLNADYRIPFTSSEADRAAATRLLEWQAPLFADPIHFGAWPRSIQDAAGSRLPSWEPEEIALVKGSHDGHFFANSYTTLFARSANNTGCENDDTLCGFGCDPAAETSGYNWTSGEPIGTPSSNGWLFNYGPGLGDLLAWYNQRYPGLRYIVTENGWGNASTSLEEDVHDMERCNYYRDYIGNLSAIAHRQNITVDAYFAWSLMDNYEWADGYTTRFGLVHIDYEKQVRRPKLSSRWFKKHITSLPSLPDDGKPLPSCETVQGLDTAKPADIIIF